MSYPENKTVRREQAAETRRNLLDTARRLFAENGYTATSVRNINHSAGVADGLLYHYFPGGKKEILQVIVIDNFEKIRSRLNKNAEELDKLPLEEAIERIYQNWFDVFQEHQDVMKIVLKENEIMQIVKNEWLSEIMHGGDMGFPEFLRKRALRGEISEIDYESAAEMLKAVLLCYFIKLLIGFGLDGLCDASHRRKLIAYQVQLWKNPQSECPTNLGSEGRTQTKCYS